ncbi:MAG: metalloregulator ArsR/SmtB family transcription factor [bacterium]|nr:metalloregulator ArsR/SmtB family transcription factor [bacterium]
MELDTVVGADVIFKAVAEGTRRRILQVLLQHELSVGELVTVLGHPQSTVSRHLGILRSAELISDHRNGAAVHYAMSSATVGGDNEALGTQVVRWLEKERLPEVLLKRLEEVLECRHAEAVDFFEGVGGRWDQMRTDCFGSGFHLEALAALLPGEWSVADIGCGTGYLLGPLAAVFAKVVAVEPVAALLRAARERPELAGVGHVEFRSGDLRNLPLSDGEVDLAIAMLVLHHVPDPAGALREVSRVVKPGGRVLVVEQQPHRSEAFRELMQDRWWGFEPADLAEQLGAVGFTRVGWHELRSAAATSASAPETPGLFVLSGVKEE